MDQDKPNRLDELIQNEILQLKSDEDTLHPEVIRLLNKFKINERKREFELEHTNTNTDSPKRIRMDRYTSNSNDLATLQAMNSYLDHEIITLSKNLPLTIANQWAINNDYLSTTSTITQNNINIQSRHLHQLNTLLNKK
ncbi:pre-mRNA-splicing factor Snt309p [Monosporozyma unispora]